VGRKVADCIILFSLCRDDCIPVDTHAWQLMVSESPAVVVAAAAAAACVAC
jgi:3-methyladenine DNA glycosylase/8-oxoguanine DNA glycosylase